MDVQDFAATEVDQNVFASAADSVDGAAGCAFLDRSRELRTGHARAENPDGGDFGVEGVAAEAAADCFDFRKFRHGEEVARIECLGNAYASGGTQSPRKRNSPSSSNGHQESLALR